MRTTLPPSTDPRMTQAASALRACVHCGMCNSSCPTYALTGSELDGPRGRIYLIKNLLEGEPASAQVTLRHLDNCLTCLACAEACPSHVDYAHLLDLGRETAEEQHPRPQTERLLRTALATMLTRPRLFAFGISLARLMRPLRAILPPPLRGLLASVPPRLPRPAPPPKVANPHKRVLLLDGCVQQTLAPHINAATASLLARHNIQAASCAKVTCCGALQWHLGFHAAARKRARANIHAWLSQSQRDTADALVMTASGCAAAVRDYPAWFASESHTRQDAERLAAMTCDFGEYLHALPQTTPADPPLQTISSLSIAWHAPCSLTNGGRFRDHGRQLLAQAGFSLCPPPRSAACCGSAGAYHLLRPHLSRPLARRKAADFAALGPDIIATANIGCLLQIRSATDMPVFHIAQLLDWAHGGPPPPSLHSTDK